MPTIILLAKIKVLPTSWFCSFEKASTIIVESGSEMINPPKIGLVFAIHKTSVSSEDVSAKFNKTADIGAPKHESSKYQVQGQKNSKIINT